jgi:hypothetical protein
VSESITNVSESMIGARAGWTGGFEIITENISKPVN